MHKANKGVFRAAREEDWDSIYSFVDRIRMRKNETNFVRELKEKNEVVHTTVIDRNGDINGLISYSRLKLMTDNVLNDALVMAPFMVDPMWQGQGLGAELIRQSHVQLIEQKEKLVFVLGEETHYNRFGYTRATASSYTGPYQGPFLLACKWSKDIPSTGSLIYPDAFTHLTQ